MRCGQGAWEQRVNVGLGPDVWALALRFCLRFCCYTRCHMDAVVEEHPLQGCHMSPTFQSESIV